MRTTAPPGGGTSGAPASVAGAGAVFSVCRVAVRAVRPATVFPGALRLATFFAAAFFLTVLLTVLLTARVAACLVFGLLAEVFFATFLRGLLAAFLAIALAPV
jgi:hypothetical protein